MFQLPALLRLLFTGEVFYQLPERFKLICMKNNHDIAITHLQAASFCTLHNISFSITLVTGMVLAHKKDLMDVVPKYLLVPEKILTLLETRFTQNGN